MKLSKANEETLKGLARLLKNLKETDGDEAVKLFHQEARGLEKDLRRLRQNLKDMPELSEVNPPNVAIFRNEDHLDIRIAPHISNPQAEQDLEQSLNELRALRNEPPVTFGTNKENPCKSIDLGMNEVQLSPPMPCVLGTTLIMDEPVIYVNMAQIESGNKLIAVRTHEELPNFTEPLYRKKK